MAKPNQSTALALPSDLMGTGKLSPEQLAGLAKSPNVKMDPKVFSLREAGDKISGTYRGKGDGIEAEDAATGELRTLRTWIFEVAPGVLFALVGNHQVDRRLEKTTDGEILTIVRGDSVRTRKGTQVTEMHIFSHGFAS